MLQFTFTAIATAHMTARGYGSYEMLGTIPDMLSVDDPAGAVDQIDRAYRECGGGWRDQTSNKIDFERLELRYPGDPARPLIAEAMLRDERVMFFNGAWLAVVQPDGTYRVARID